MKEQTIELWDAPADAICITTNGCIDSTGRAIMGGGVALEAVTRYPEISVELGNQLQLRGNHVYLLIEDETASMEEYDILSFPTKAHPAMRSSTALIHRSARELVFIADDYGYKNVYIPRPGCGLGGLLWEHVKPILETILDDRFTVVTK